MKQGGKFFTNPRHRHILKLNNKITSITEPIFKPSNKFDWIIVIILTKINISYIPPMKNMECSCGVQCRRQPTPPVQHENIDR